MPTSEIASASEEICRRLAREVGLLSGVRTVAIYSAHGPEISLASLHALLPEKKILYPLCHPSEKKLTFHHVKKPAELAPGMLDILEPLAGQHTEVPLADVDLIVCPGLAFGSDGTRLGYGGGYYDRVLENYSGVIWGVALHGQIIVRLPREAHDIAVHRVMTERGFTPPS